MKSKTKRIISITIISLILILAVFYFVVKPRYITFTPANNTLGISLSSISLNSLTNDSSQPTYYYTRYTGCNTPLNSSQLGVIGHGVYFSSQSDCQNYNNPIGYQEIYPW